MIDINDAWYRVSVKALIYDENGDILLCKEEDGRWDLPGGGLDHGEKPVDCLKRELMEEMGLEATYIDKSPKYFVTAHQAYSKSRPWKATVCFETKVKDLNFIPSDECVEIGFFNKETVKSINVFENVTELFNEM